MEENTGFINDGSGDNTVAPANNPSATQEGDAGTQQFINPSPESDESNQGNDGHGDSDSTQNAAAESPKWKAQLPDHLKANEALDQYESIGALAEAVLQVQDGNKAEVAVPADDDAEAWGELYSKLGRPEKSDDYQLADDLSLPDQVAQSVKDTAYDMGLNQQQFDKLTAVMGNAVEYDKVLQAARYEGTAEDAEKNLRSEWGEHFDERREFMKRGAQELLSPELRKVLGLHNQLNNPEIAKKLAAYGEYVSDDIPSNGAQKTVESDDWDYPEA